MTTDPLASRPPLWFVDTLAYVHVDAELSGGAFSMHENWGGRGNMPPLHVHHRDDETFYVLDGEVRLFVGDREIVLATGQAALARHGIAHTYRVDSDQGPAGS